MMAASAGAAAKLAIAKASLSAALFRADPDPCSREDIDTLHYLLGSATTRCSPGNVQTCKQWILQHVARSSNRTLALGKYLATLADSFSTAPTAAAAAIPAPGSDKQTSDRRRRLHLLYIVSDTLYHTTIRDHNDVFARGLGSSLVLLVRSAASFAQAPKQLHKIRALLGLWSEKRYFPPETLTKLREAADEGPVLSEQGQSLAQTNANRPSQLSALPKEQPYVLPAAHGDLSTPWYDLPAATWLAVLEPNSTRPMNPSAIKPVPMQRGPAVPALVDSVQKLLADVQRIFGTDPGEDSLGEMATDAGLDIDPMGEHVELDVFSGEVLDGDTYYGWSRAFCQKMRARRQGRQQPQEQPQQQQQQQQQQQSQLEPSSPSEMDDHRGRLRRSRSYSYSSHDSRDSSVPAYKRRRVTSQNKVGGSHSSSRLRVPSRGHGRSASPSRHRDDHRRFARNRSRSLSRSRSRSRTSRSPYSPSANDHDNVDEDDENRNTHRQKQYSRSHSHHRHNHNRHRGLDRSRARSRFRSRSRSRSQSRSRSRSPRYASRDRYSPLPPPRSEVYGSHRFPGAVPSASSPPPPPRFDSSGRVPFPPIPLPPASFAAGATFAAMPPLPPPPPNYNGPWPPPIPFPPPPPHMLAVGQSWVPQPPPMAGGSSSINSGPAAAWGPWPPHLPPPPHLQQHQQQQRQQQQQQTQPWLPPNPYASQQGGWGAQR